MFSASKTAAPVSGSYQVSNSLRFRSSASAYLNRTPSVAGNRQTWTWSGWMKLGAIQPGTNIFGCTTDNYNVNYFALYFHSTLGIRFENVSGGATQMGANITSQVFRDPSAWYHIILSIDTTQSTASNRVKFYVNGVQVTNWAQTSYPAQNAVLLVNSTIQHDISSSNAGLTRFDGYMAEVNFIDGQALTPSSFGSINATTGVWQPARYTGSYGTNGFYLKFNNGTSTTTLGNDSSGNNNNWTTNNISLTAGSTYDWMIDSPTSYAGSSYGVGNYCVLNPNDTGGGSVTVSGGNLNYSIASSGGSQVRGSVGSGLTGKWYWEYVNGTTATALTPVVFGLSTTYGQITNNSTSLRKAATIYTDGVTNYVAEYRLNGSSQSSFNTQFASAAIGNIFQVAYDADTGKVWFGKNNTWYDAVNSTTGNPSTGANPVFTIATGDPMTPLLTNIGATYSGSLNCGQRPFAYTPPTGYKSLCTQNLPAPAIYNGAQYMAATTYTGTGSSLSISNSVNSASFQPDFVWIKSRSAATDHKLTDSVRGVTKGLISNTTGAETTDTNGLTAFGASGFTIGTDTVYNNSGSTYVGWQWKAGGTAVTNTAGSITSSVSANTTSGFAVVTYAGSGSAGSTVGHGLGIAPSMIILKNRSSATSWPVMHTSLPTNGNMFLDLTQAYQTTYAAGGLLNPATSTTFGFTTTSTLQQVNASGNNYVAYCFAAIPGYSAFGSYTGNGSADGPFVYCGFRPRFVLLKASSFAGESWYIFDTARNTYNVIGEGLVPNLNIAEFSASLLDVLSNGFKIRAVNTLHNSSGATYIYAAFAESPLKFSLAR